AQVQLLGGDQREAFVEVEAHLPAEHAARAGAGAVGLLGAVFEHVAQQVEVLLHAASVCAAGRGCSVGARRDIHSHAIPTRINGTLSTWPIVSQPKARYLSWSSGTRTNSTANRNTPYSS